MTPLSSTLDEDRSPTQTAKVKQTDVPMIIRPIPRQSEHADALAAVIGKKNARFQDYGVGLSHVNLIVVDRFGAPFGAEPEYSITDLVAGSLRKALETTPFREVFVVTTNKEGERIYRPFRMLLLVESFKLFQGKVLDEYDRLVDEFGLSVVNATGSITDQQRVFRKLVSQHLEIKDDSESNPDDLA